MKMEEAMSNNVDTNVALLNDLLAKMSDDPNECVESRFGQLIALHFKNDIGGLISCMDVAFTQSWREVADQKIYEDPVIRECPHCRPRYDYLIFFEGKPWYICYEHLNRWTIGKSLFSTWRLNSDDWSKEVESYFSGYGRDND